MFILRYNFLALNSPLMRIVVNSVNVLLCMGESLDVLLRRYEVWNDVFCGDDVVGVSAYRRR